MLLGDDSVSKDRVSGNTGALGPTSPSGRVSAVLKMTSDLGVSWVVLREVGSSTDPDATRSGASSERMQEASRRFPIPACPTSYRGAKEVSVDRRITRPQSNGELERCLASIEATAWGVVKFMAERRSIREAEHKNALCWRDRLAKSQIRSPPTTEPFGPAPGGSTPGRQPIAIDPITVVRTITQMVSW